VKLTKSEEKIREALEAGPLDAEGIAAILYVDRPRPAFWRSSVSAIMRYLRVKTMNDSKPVVRSSALGRGRKAEYALGDGS
jgi:hypothetical protein